MKQDGTVINAMKITVTNKNGKMGDEIKIQRLTRCFVSYGKLNSLSKFKKKNTKPIISNKKRMLAYSRRLLSKRREIGNDEVLTVGNG